MARDWRIDVLRGLGAPVTKQNLSFLGSWQRWEGGHTHNDARFNWLNTTSGSQYEAINPVGVRRFPNYKTGIRYTLRTLRNGRYDDIIRALRSGDPYKAAPRAGLSTWVSGSPTGNLEYANKVLGSRHDVTVPADVSRKPAAVADDGKSVTDGYQGKYADLVSRFAEQRQQQQGSPAARLASFPRYGEWKQSRSSGEKPPAAEPDGEKPAEPGGGWGGSYALAAQAAEIAKEMGLKVISEKRDTKYTASGGVSDHWTGSKNSYAFDLSNGDSPTPEMDAAARRLARMLGEDYDGKSELVLTKTIGGYRFQILYRTNVGGNHFNHIHFGVRLVV